MGVAIVDYNAGNLRSVLRACQKVGLPAFITSDPDKIAAADRVIFPGVGSAASAVDTLHERGLFKALLDYFNTGRPFLGICLGCQVLLDFSEEGKKDCLGLIPGGCERFNLPDRSLKVPHMGWNEITIRQSHPLLRQIETGDEFYFVHSYFTRPKNTEHIVATTEYGHEFCSVLARDNLFATQFHLEKSGEKGLLILEDFGKWNGEATC